MKVLAQLVHSVKWKPFLTASLWHHCYLISLVTRWFAKWFNPGSVPPKTSNHHFADAFLLIIFWRKEFQPLIMGHCALGAGRLRITKIGVTQCHTHSQPVVYLRSRHVGDLGWSPPRRSGQFDFWSLFTRAELRSKLFKPASVRHSGSGAFLDLLLIALWTLRPLACCPSSREKQMKHVVIFTCKE